jgi:arsenite-transporting ATPase
MSVASLIDSRLVMVTGKGGTGKTTLAAALAVVAAAKGKRVLLCEVDNQRPSLTPIFGTMPGFKPVEVQKGLAISNILFAEALEDFIQNVVPVRRFVKMVLENKVVGRFLDFAPGTRELVALARLATLVQQYDLVVVDMPASGHAFSLLDIVRSAVGLFRSGPVRKLAEDLRALLRDRRSRVLFVGLPEEMVVNETLETLERMRRAEVLGGEPVAILNRATLPSLTDAERAFLKQLGGGELSSLEREFVRAGLWEDALEQATAESSERLARAFPEAPLLVPPSGPGGVPRHVVAGVAVHLGRSVGLTRRELPWT